MGQSAPFRVIKVLHHLGGILYFNNYLISTSGWLRPMLLLIISVMLSLWLTSGSVEANILFQSPQSPPIQPAVEQPPLAQPAPAEQPPVEQPPVQQPPVEQPPVEQPPVQQPPVEQPPVVQPPAEHAEQPVPENVAPVAQPDTSAAPVQPTPEPVRRQQDETAPIEADPAGPSNFILDQAELIDTVVVSGAYVWLCCGVSLFLLVPLFLLFVYIRGRSKIIQEENY